MKYLNVVGGARRLIERGLRAARGGVLSGAALGVVLVAVTAVAAWNLSGGKLLVMTTPSMCPKVCVGALVVERPVRGALHTGELITFHPPNTLKETYTHEISRIFPNGMVQTKGLANLGPDPWLITRRDMVGEAELSVWGLGWVLNALPFLAMGVFFWVASRRWIAEKGRWEWDRTWLTALVLVPLWSLRPLVRGAVTGIAPDSVHAHWSVVTVVNTGILPVAFSARSGQTTAQLATAGVARVAGPMLANRAPAIHEAISLSWWGWPLLAFGIVSPLAGYLWHIWRGTSDERPALVLSGGPLPRTRRTDSPLRPAHRARWSVLLRSGGTGGWLPRPQWRRQDDHDASCVRPYRPQHRDGQVERHGGGTARAPQVRVHARGTRAVPRHARR